MVIDTYLSIIDSKKQTKQARSTGQNLGYGEGFDVCQM